MTVIGIERIRDELSKLKPELKKPWVILDRLPYIHATDDPNAKPYSTPVVGRFDYMESADYIMACNPDAMSNVLSYVAALKSEIDRLKELADSEGTRAVEYLRRARKAEAEIKQLRKDAERYRWMRDELIDYKPAGYDGRNVGRFDLVLDFPERDLDAAIDAAMKGTP